VLENEVKHGLMENAEERALIFERTITDLSNYLMEERAHAFTEIEWDEVEETWRTNPVTDELLKSMKVPLISESAGLFTSHPFCALTPSTTVHKVAYYWRQKCHLSLIKEHKPL